MKMELKQKYTIKGINKDQTVESVVEIHTDQAGKITKLMDKWNGSLPDSSIADVSLNPVWWLHYWYTWAWWWWSFVWWTWPWRVGDLIETMALTNHD